MLGKKKTRYICLVTIIFIYLSVMTVFSQGQAALKMNSAYGVKGDKVKITITLDEPENITGLQFILKYDNNKLSVNDKDIVMGSYFKGWLYVVNVIDSEGEIRFALASSTGIKDRKCVDIIQTAFDKGLISGYGDNTIRAGSRLTRAEAAVIVMRAFKFSPVNKSRLNYKDLSQIPLWSKEYIESAYSLGIISGFGDNTFRPNKYITRGELIKIISMCLTKTYN